MAVTRARGNVVKMTASGDILTGNTIPYAIKAVNMTSTGDLLEIQDAAGKTVAKFSASKAGHEGVMYFHGRHKFTNLTVADLDSGTCLILL